MDIIPPTNHSLPAMRITCQDLGTFRTEILALREEMGTKNDHVVLETRVKALESGDLAAPELSWLQQQVQRLDPANRSLCCEGLSQSNPSTRKTVLEDLLENVGTKSAILNIEHIYKGPEGNRTISPMSIVDFASRSSREASLLKLNEATSLLKSDGKGKLEVQRAKTASQLKRNASLTRVCDLIKKGARAKDKTVDIVWKKDGLRAGSLKWPAFQFSNIRQQI